MWLLAIFIVVPLIEIALFITVGGWLTLWPTLGVVVATALVGSWMVRRQGLQVLAEVRRSAGELRDPMAPLAHGALVLVAGLLLLTPGFLTDTIGLLLLIPPVRSALIAWALERGMATVVGGAAPRAPRRFDVIDAEFREVGDAAPSNEPGSSGWTRH